MDFKYTETKSPNFNQVAYNLQVSAPPIVFKPEIERLIPHFRSQPRRVLSRLQTTIETYTKEFDQINAFRKKYIEVIARFIQDDLTRLGCAKIIFICTHNSRRSHLAQIWAQTAAFYYGVKKVKCYSGGMEETAFYQTALEVVKDQGFLVEKKNQSSNPTYEVFYSWQASPAMIFSKKYGDAHNPQNDFTAILTCSQIHEARPEVEGASRKFSLLYKDPREQDGTPLELGAYQERAGQIARDLLYLFKHLKKLSEEQEA